MSIQSQKARDRAAERAAKGLPAMIDEASVTLEMLRTEADRVRGFLAMFGFGRRILVPPDEIHVVVGDGRHIFVLSRKSRVFGQTADRSSTYWLNRLSQVIKLKTISFTVPIRGVDEEGVPALDSSKVSFNLWAHAVAKLNPDKAEVAAQRVGLDATSLINTITEVGTAELVAAAATMTLEEIIAQRQKLAEIAFPQVNQILSELGYDLALLTITNLGGVAYTKLINQAEARISKETSIATNREQVAELQDDEARQRQESEIKATTEKKLAAERLDAEREVETATLNQQETLAVQRHEVKLLQVDRDKDAARATHEAELAKVQLGRQLSEAEVEKQAQLARVTAERDAELRAMQQERNAKIRVAEAEAEAERLAVEQVRKLERDAERTQAEAKRLEQEELAKAQRAKQVALVEAAQLGESLKVEAEAESRALQIKADAETKAELIRAEAEATATEKRAQAAKIRAEATRAEAAAPGLAEAEVAQAQAAAEAERTQRLKEIDINAQRELVKLYDQAPVLVELEKLRLQLGHEERLATLQMEAYLKAFEALAPSLQVRIYGSGGQTTRIITDLMSVAQGVKVLGEEIPAVGRLVGNGDGADALNWLPKLADFVPFIRQAMAGVNPRMFTSLKVTDLLDRLVPVLAGREDLLTALDALREDAGFRVVGDVPVVPLLRLLGIKVPEAAVASTVKPVDAGIVVENGEQPDEDQKSVAAAMV